MTTKQGHHKEECQCDECCPPKPMTDLNAARRLADPHHAKLLVFALGPAAHLAEQSGWPGIAADVRGAARALTALADEVERLRAESPSERIHRVLGDPTKGVTMPTQEQIDSGDFNPFRGEL